MSHIAAAFNPRIPMPRLLADFESGFGQFDYGALGYCELVADHLDDYWIEDGSQLADRFALWLKLGNGSLIGFWRPEHFGGDDVLPVVLLGSEGGQEVLADSLEDFLYRWAECGDLGSAGYDLLPEEEEDEDDECSLEECTVCRHAELLQWLQAQDIRRPQPARQVGTGMLKAFLDACQAEHAPK
ncbi:hypothetical protein L1281_000777 [Neisseria sp. HSC-16F19]|nr:hypothetical protein [Neisseria sp. HSC-16F19]MCP2040197.1 hypothetical protein [Neisseria sp. HSC-16F19]